MTEAGLQPLELSQVVLEAIGTCEVGLLVVAVDEVLDGAHDLSLLSRTETVPAGKYLAETGVDLVGGMYIDVRRHLQSALDHRAMCRQDLPESPDMIVGHPRILTGSYLSRCYRDGRS